VNVTANAPTSLGFEIRDRRVALGLSVRSLASRAGVSPAYVTAIETAKNPSTGRAPVPSVAIVSRLADALGVDVGSLLRESGSAAAPSHGSHVLVYVLAPPPAGLLTAVDGLLGADVDHWLHIADPRGGGEGVSARATTRRFALGSYPYATPWLAPADLVSALDGEVAAIAPSHAGQAVGLLISDCSAVMRYLQDAASEVELEAEWHDHVQRIWATRLAAPPVVDVCAYLHADIEALGLTIDPLATALELIGRHDRVIVLDGTVATSGAAAIRRVLDHARPAGTSSPAWNQLVTAAAATLASAGRG
jgi:transcriptional regulator with XRE-family HTH domain